ncbi:MAG TPA: hypothetical protein ENH24_04895 [Nitrospirae bacterium]|nr:hypothetical protein [Nitrospirota bacterium]
MSVMGLDVGYQRIGAAVSNCPEFTAQGMDTVSRNDYMAALKRSVEEYSAAILQNCFDTKSP